jgi:hypothetical protein
MDQLRRSLADVRQFLEPATAFTSGLKMYEPDAGDTSAEAKLKRKIFELADVAQLRAQSILAGDKTAGSLTFDAALFDQIETQISAAEQNEFNAFASAIERLVSETNAITNSL